MTLDELLNKIAGEPPRAFEQEVHVASPELIAEVHRRGWMRLTDFTSDPRRTLERRTLRRGHVLGPGAPPADLDAWRTRWRLHPLPQDLVELLSKVNGIHLWADLDSGRSYEGLAPLDEWDLARVKMWGPDADAGALPDRYLGLSYHADGAAFLVLNTDTGRYSLMDSCGADESCVVGENVGDLLDWLWEHRLR
jgi:hypothetical protein